LYRVAERAIGWPNAGVVSVRYLHLIALLAVVTVGTRVLEAGAADLIPVLREEAAAYLVGTIGIGILVAVTCPQSVRRFIRLYSTNLPRSAAGFLVMLGFGLAMLLALTLFLGLSGRATWGEGGISPAPHLVPIAIAATLLGAIAIAVPEEILFRGFVVSYLRWNTSPLVSTAAVVASALVFAAAHNIENPLVWLTPAGFPLFVGLFLLGTLLAVSYLATRSLWCPIGLHAALVAFDRAVLNTDLVAIDLSPWWMGGTDDVREAPALWLTFVIAALLCILFRNWLRSRLAIEDSYVGALTAPHAVDSIGRWERRRKLVLPNSLNRRPRGNASIAFAVSAVPEKREP
jgi:membrane protease YdiL (CAAX protease family)